MIVEMKKSCSIEENSRTIRLMDDFENFPFVTSEFPSTNKFTRPADVPTKNLFH